MSQATATTPENSQLRKHTSNPVEINIHTLTATARQRANERFLAESIAIHLVERQANNHFTFEARAGRKNNHFGLVYQVEVYRGEDHHVYSRCTCASKLHCKHIEGCYREAHSLVYMHSENCLACGKAFETTDSAYCFECLTDWPQAEEAEYTPEMEAKDRSDLFG